MLINEFGYIVIIDYKNPCCAQFASLARIMAFIIAVQSSFFTDDKLEVKQIAVVGLQKQYLFHWIISPPYEFSELSKISRQHSTNNIMREYHLCWTDRKN